MNLIVISTGSRPALLRQTLTSLRLNAADWSSHHLTVVLDGPVTVEVRNLVEDSAADTVILNMKRVGASRSRNIGASSIPAYLRQRDVMFCDDDIFAINGWDDSLQELINRTEIVRRPNSAYSLCSHPYNLPIGGNEYFDEYGVLSTVCFSMSWALWDRVGYWTEPGGQGGSEDCNYCIRAQEQDAKFYIPKQQSILHCGLTSSNGKPIVGSQELAAMNDRIIQERGLVGRVLML